MVLEAALHSLSNKARTYNEWPVVSTLCKSMRQFQVLEQKAHRMPLQNCDLVSFRVSKEESIMHAGGRQVRIVLIYCKKCDLVSFHVSKEESNVHVGGGGAGEKSPNLLLIFPIGLKCVAMPADHTEDRILHVQALQRECLSFSSG